MLSIGMLFVIPPSYKVYAYAAVYINAVPTEGIVTKAGVGNFLGSRPFVKYTDRHGKVHEFKSEINFYWLFMPQKGDPIDLLVRQDTPDAAIINSYFHYIVLPLLLLSVGLAVVFRFLQIAIHSKGE